jgi:excisionase family DNA binding protein
MPLVFVRKPSIPARPVQSTPPRALKLLSVRDAADFAKVSTQTVRRLIKAGKLKVYRVGRQIRIDESDLIDIISGEDSK